MKLWNPAGLMSFKQRDSQEAPQITRFGPNNVNFGPAEFLNELTEWHVCHSVFHKFSWHLYII